MGLFHGQTATATGNRKLLFPRRCRLTRCAQPLGHLLDFLIDALVNVVLLYLAIEAHSDLRSHRTRWFLLSLSIRGLLLTNSQYYNMPSCKKVLAKLCNGLEALSL